MADYDAIVIGAGMGGLTSASILAKQGMKVLLLEQSGDIGGCCSTFEKEGFNFDVGASIVEEIQPIEYAFELLGTTFQAEVNLIPCDPMMSFVLTDGSRVTYPISLEATADVISRMSTEDGRAFPGFAGYFAGLVRASMKGLFISPTNTLTDMVRMIAGSPALLKYAPLFVKSYQDVICGYFKDERVRETMSYQSLYIGLPPELVPGLFALIPYSEHEGIWYPRGGMKQIPAAFRRCGEKHGLEVRLRSMVDRVIVRDRRAEGVVLSDGTEITSRVVVSDINARTLYLEKIGEEHLPWIARYGIKSYAYSKSVPMIYMGIDFEPPLEAHHTVMTETMEGMNDYWWNNVMKGVLRDRMIGLICWPTDADPGLAPEGHHILNLIPEGFYHLSGTDWDAEKEAFVERTIDDLSERAIPGLKDHIKVVECITPKDFERRLLLPEGAIYDLQQDITSTTLFKVSSRSKCIKGLYLCGNSCHPGGGVSTTTASGVIAAGLVEKYEG